MIRDSVLRKRYEALFPGAAAAAAPKPAAAPAVSSMFDAVKDYNASLSAEELGEREQARRSAQARRQIDAAIAEEEKAAASAQKQAITDTIELTAIGGLLTRR
jgi:hypothetical protein